MHTIHQLPVAQRFRLLALGAAALFLGSAPALAQQAPATIRLEPSDAERGLNGPQHNFDFLAPGADGNQYQTAGFFGQKLRPYLAGNAEALDYLNDYKRQKTLYLVDRVVALGAFGLYGQQIFAGGEAQYFNSTQKVAIGVFATSVLASAFINRNTNSHLQRAVKAYNDEVAYQQPKRRLRPSAVGIGMASTGQPVLALRWALR